MYKVNTTLRFFILLLIVCSIVFINSRLILWLYLLIISVYNIYKRNILLSFVSIILNILFPLSVNNVIILFFFKLVLILDFIYTFYIYFINVNDSTKKVRKKVKSKFFQDNYDKIVDSINKKKEQYYVRDISTDGEIERVLERRYLESRIRFYGFSDSSDTKEDYWTKIDTLILAISIIIFILIIIIGR